MKEACALALFIEMDLFFHTAGSSQHLFYINGVQQKESSVWRGEIKENKDLVANEVWFLNKIFCLDFKKCLVSNTVNELS